MNEMSKVLFDNQKWCDIVEAIVKNQESGDYWKTILSEYEPVTYEEALALDSTYRHAAHALIWSENDGLLWEYKLRASIFMQLRFDGFLGFPGGFIDSTDDSWEDGLNRELNEELGVEKSDLEINKDDHFFSSKSEKQKLVLHFYIKKLTPEEYERIERKSIESRDYRGEVMGIVRVPLFETNKKRGFNVFIRNKFIGNALIQLLKSISHLEILSKDEIIHFINLN
jgi:U8 snoRNA-decapping enzyme